MPDFKPGDDPQLRNDWQTETPAPTAGEQSHSDVEQYRGDDAEAPAETGEPPKED